MMILKNEHLEDEVLNAIRLKAESIMPKDAKVILFGSRARRDAKGRFRLGPPCASERRISR